MTKRESSSFSNPRNAVCKPRKSSLSIVLSQGILKTRSSRKSDGFRYYTVNKSTGASKSVERHLVPRLWSTKVRSRCSSSLQMGTLTRLMMSTNLLMLLLTIFGTSKRQLLEKTLSFLRLTIKMDNQSISKNLESESIDAKAIQFIFHFD